MTKKLLALAMVLVLVSGFAAAATANVNGGFYQEAYFNSQTSSDLVTATGLQLDVNNFIIESPMDLNTFSVGIQMPINILGRACYTKPMLEFKKFKPSGFSFAIGKEFILNYYTFKIEGTIENPDWTSWTNWGVSPAVAINFNLSDFFDTSNPSK